MRLLTLTLAMLPFAASAQTFYKVHEDAFFCHNKEPIVELQKSLDLDIPSEQLTEMIEFAASTPICGFTRPGLIGTLVDFHKGFLQLRILNSDNNPQIWVHRNQTSN